MKNKLMVDLLLLSLLSEDDIALLTEMIEEPSPEEVAQFAPLEKLILEDEGNNENL